MFSYPDGGPLERTAGAGHVLQRGRRAVWAGQQGWVEVAAGLREQAGACFAWGAAWLPASIPVSPSSVLFSAAACWPGRQAFCRGAELADGAPAGGRGAVPSGDACRRHQLGCPARLPGLDQPLNPARLPAASLPLPQRWLALWPVGAPLHVSHTCTLPPVLPSVLQVRHLPLCPPRHPAGLGLAASGQGDADTVRAQSGSLAVILLCSRNSSIVGFIQCGCVAASWMGAHAQQVSIHAALEHGQCFTP